MITSAILTGLFVLLSGLSVLVIAFLFYKREKQRVIRTIKAYFAPAAPDQLSEFARVTDAIAGQFASAAVSSIKGSFMGMQSVDARNIKRLEQDLTMDLVNNQSPAIGMMLEQFPGVKRRLMKNPELLPYIQQIIGKVTGPAAPAAPENNHNSETTFKGVF